MRRLTLLLLLMPLCAFAQAIEVTGQFVIAPISSERCKASAITAPTNGLPTDSKLLEMLVPFMFDNEIPTGIEHAKMDDQSVGEFSAIYDISGRKLTILQKGLNIVVDKNGKRKKIYNLREGIITH